MKLEDLLQTIKGHVNSANGIKDKEFWEQLVSLYPDVTHEGLSYRAVLTNRGMLSEARLKDISTSYSKDLEGIWAYLTDGKNYDLSRDYGFYLVKANITAIDLDKVIALAKERSIDVSFSVPEQELVLLQFHSATEIKWIPSSKDLFTKP